MGVQKIKSEERASKIDNSSCVLRQLMIQMYKTDRQIGYKPKNEKSYFNSYTETPYSVRIALDVHTSTRSEKMVNKLNDLGISISYKKTIVH